MVSTDYSDTSPNKTNFGVPATSVFVILLQNGDDLLLQDDSTRILIESGGVFRNDFTSSTVNSTQYSPKLVHRLLFQTESLFKLQDGNVLFLEEVEGKALDYTKTSVNSTQYS